MTKPKPHHFLLHIDKELFHQFRLILGHEPVAPLIRGWIRQYVAHHLHKVPSDAVPWRALPADSFANPLSVTYPGSGVVDVSAGAEPTPILRPVPSVHQDGAVVGINDAGHLLIWSAASGRRVSSGRTEAEFGRPLTTQESDLVKRERLASLRSR